MYDAFMPKIHLFDLFQIYLQAKQHTSLQTVYSKTTTNKDPTTVWTTNPQLLSKNSHLSYKKSYSLWYEPIVTVFFVYTLKHIDDFVLLLCSVTTT